LDTLRNNKKLEDTYHETAKVAFNFCMDNKRPQEFKRLCEMLRFHYQNLLKPPPNQIGPAFVSHSDPETVQKLLETRFDQLSKARDMELWREAFATSEDLHMLMSKKKPKPAMLAQYYDGLQKIFWKSENYLYHAFGMMKYYLLCKQKRNFPKEEEEQMASELLLATIVVPPDEKNVRLLESDTNAMEKRKRLARLLGSSTMPTRASLKAEIKVKRIYENACEPARRLYDVLEGNTTALELSEVTRPILEEIQQFNDGKLSQYNYELKVSVCHSILAKLCVVYSTMRLSSFKKTMDILPWNEVEKTAAAASKTGLVSLRFNYAEDTVDFSTEDFSATAMRNSLISIATTVRDFEHTFFEEEIKKSEETKRKALFENLMDRRSEEESEILHRRHVIEDRKQVREKQELEQEELEKKQAQEQAEKDEEAEKKRQAEEAKRRDRDREERIKKEKEAERTKTLLETIKEKAGKASANIKVGDKSLKDLDVEDLENLDMSQLDKAREQQQRKERDVLIRQRKAEMKRVDHTARALREEEVKLVPEWRTAEVARISKQIEAQQEKKIKLLKDKHDKMVEAKSLMTPFKRWKNEWFEEQMVARRADFAEQQKKRASRKAEQEKRNAKNKVDRARQRKQEFEEEEERKEREAEEKERRRQEEEREEAEREKRRKEREEEEEKKREAKRALDEERQRVQDKIRAKEEEMDRRRDEDRDDRDDRGKGGRRDEDDRGKGGRREEDDRGKGGRRDEDDSRFGNLRGGDRGPPRRDDRDDDDPRFRSFGRRDDRDDRGPPRRDDRDGGDNWRGGDRGPPRRDDRGPPRRDDDDDPRFSNLRGGPRRDDRDDRGPPRRDDRDGGDNWRGGDRGPPRRDDRGPPRRDDDDDPRFSNLRSGGGRDDRGPPRRDDDDDPRFSSLRGGDRGPPRRDDDDDPRFSKLRGGGGDDKFRPGMRRTEEKRDDGDWRRR